MRTKKEIEDAFDRLNEEAKKMLEKNSVNMEDLLRNLGKQSALLWVLELKHNI